jgi:hypothetical protein
MASAERRAWIPSLSDPVSGVRRSRALETGSIKDLSSEAEHRIAEAAIH